jgi:hypothetical protein
MEYRFFLNELEIDEPIGWADFELSMNRDDKYHGMQFEVSTGTLEFFGEAAQSLMTQKESFRIQANVTFISQVRCDADSEWEEVVRGRLNFGKYKDTCGATKCTVTVPFEEDDCKVIFKNRFDQKVDIEKEIAFDNATMLPEYAQIGNNIEMPAVALEAAVSGRVTDAGYNLDCSFLFGNLSWFLYERPNYEVEISNTIDTGQLEAVNNIETGLGQEQMDCINGPLTPQLLLEEPDGIKCFNGDFVYHSRMKGSINLSTLDDQDAGLVEKVKHVIIRWDGVTGSVISNGGLVAEHTIADYTGSPVGPPLTILFDDILDGSIALADGEGLYAVIDIELVNGGTISGININTIWDKETEFSISATRECPASEVQYYMVHETLSRVTEAVTNSCVRVKSEYYGRIDSQPFAFDNDGCGSLRMLTNGLKLRKAPDAKFFASPKDLIAGLNAIDNIGFDMQADPYIPNRLVLRVEPMEYFYQDQELLSIDGVALANNEIQESMHYAKINVGYKKWEVESVNGLNEFNSTREYRTNIETINTTLDIQSDLVAGSIPIEVTRQQTFADSGAADTSYDNDIFIVCLNRSAYQFNVERNNILNSSNIFNSATTLNFRISPLRNLMRWFKSIINSYASISSTSSGLFFNEGKGNFTAAGLLDDNGPCRLENTTIAENSDLDSSYFQDQSKATPVIMNETVSFEYPLSVAQYKQIKANPYGYISYTCGNDPIIRKAFVKEIKFRPAAGTANFTLIKKWGQ